MRLRIGREGGGRAEGIEVVGDCWVEVFERDLGGSLGDTTGGEAPTRDDATKSHSKNCGAISTKKPR